MRVDNHPAFILHHYPYRDSSQILELLTKDYGRLSVVSRGSLAARSKLKSVLQPFRLLHVSWAGKTDLPTLTHAELVQSNALLLTGDKFASGFYLNELMMHFLHRHDVQEQIFAIYSAAITQLAETTSLEIVLRLFEKQLLNELGLGLNLTHDADSGSPLLESALYQYQVEHGAVMSMFPELASPRPLVRGSSLLAFSVDDLQAEQTRRDIKILMRHVLAFYLDGKPLKSRELFR
jgi:DNA repair protein RecO (recombination protein O)